MRIRTLLFFFALVMSSCSSIDKKQTKEVFTADSAAKNIAADTSLQGTFSNNCAVSGAMGGSNQLKVGFHGDKFTQQMMFFKDNVCREIAMKIVYVGEFMVDEASPNTIYLNIEDAYIETISPKITALLNQASFCGHNDYATGSHVFVTSSTSRVSCPLRSVPAMTQATYVTENRHLYFEIYEPSFEPASREERLNHINRENFFVRE